MAERRMFAKSIVNSARFLRMPKTSRLLYYDLGMAADDDGIVEAFTVMRMTGADDDDLRVLVARGFVSILNEDLVAYIRDWRKNNYIQADRYHPSVYGELLLKISPQNDLDAPCIHDGYNSDTESRVDKSSLDKVRRGEIYFAPDVSSDKPAMQGKTYGKDEFPYNMAIHLSRQIAKNTPDSKPISETQLQSWADSFQLLFEDGYEWCLLADAVDCFSRDELLKISTLSNSEFREELLRLIAKWKNTVDATIAEAVRKNS